MTATEELPEGLVLFSDGIWPLCPKGRHGEPCPEPESDCEDCEGPRARDARGPRDPA